MTISDIDTRINFFTGANATNYTNANRLISLNNVVYDIETEILMAQDGWDFDDTNKTDFPILTTNIVADQFDYGMPTGYIRISRAEISYDGGTTWAKLIRGDVQEDSNPTDITSILNNYSTSKPIYDLVGNSIIIKPTPTVNGTSCLKIWVERLATAFSSADYTGGTKSPGFDVQFHDMVPIKMSMDWCVANDMARLGNLNALWQQYLERLKGFYGSRDKDTNYSFSSSNKNFQ